MKYLSCFLLLITSCLYAQESEDSVSASPVEETEYSEDEDQLSEEEASDEESYSEDSDGVVHNSLKPGETTASKAYLDEKRYHKGFDENKWREIVGENDFKQNAPDPPNRRLPSLSWANELMKAIGYAVIVAIVLTLLYLVFKNIKVNKKVRKAGIAPFATQHDDDIREMDIPSLLKQALAEKNFRLAVRLYYLLLLKNLNDAGMIKWEKDKTNRDYLSELFSQENLYDDVRKLTTRYEEVWFSDHHFADDSLMSLISRFESMQSRINPPKAQ
jgi:hypothetical protein